MWHFKHYVLFTICSMSIVLPLANLLNISHIE